jgi:adenylate kinase family enzyme
MRVVVVGTSGSGKSTFARQLCAAVGAPQMEVDAINWRAGWRDLNTHDPEAFVRRVAEATEAPAWVADGNYSKVRHVLWPRATRFVWLDYERPVIMRRIIGRSLRRALDGRELWPGTGNTETIADWLDKEHPIRWAWDTWAKNRTRYGEVFADPAFAAIPMDRLRHPRDAAPLIAHLAAGQPLPI